MPRWCGRPRARGQRCWSTGAGCRSPRAPAPRKRRPTICGPGSWGRRCRGWARSPAGLADNDLGAGHGEVTPRRLAVNFSKSPAIVPSELKTIGDVRVGIFGVADPALAARVGATAEDPVPAAKREVARLRGAGAELVIALVRSIARRRDGWRARRRPIWSSSGGRWASGQARAEQVGSTFLVSAAEELARVGRIDFVLRGPGALTDAGGPEAAALRRVEIDAAAARLDEELKRWSSGRKCRRRPRLHRRQTPRARGARRGEEEPRASLDAPGHRQLLHQSIDPAAPQPRAR